MLVEHPGPAPYARVPPNYFVAEGLNAAIILALVVRAYALSDALLRRQARWVAFTGGLAAVSIGSYDVLKILGAPLAPSRQFVQLSVIIVPLGTWIAIARYDLFDIDRLIGSTVTYLLLGIVLLTGILVAVPRLAAAASSRFEPRPDVPIRGRSRLEDLYALPLPQAPLR